MALARLRVAALDEDPHVAEAGGAVLDGVDAPFELGALASEFGQQPGENVIRVRSTHVDMVKAEQFGILHDFDASAPRVFHKTEFEEAFDIARGRDDLNAGGLELFHLGVQIRKREAYVVDGAAAA